MNTKKIAKELNALPPVFSTRAQMSLLLYEMAGKTPPQDLKDRAASGPPMQSAQYKPTDVPELVAKANDPTRRHLLRKEELDVLVRNRAVKL